MEEGSEGQRQRLSLLGVHKPLKRVPTKTFQPPILPSVMRPFEGCAGYLRVIGGTVVLFPAPLSWALGILCFQSWISVIATFSTPAEVPSPRSLLNKLRN